MRNLCIGLLLTILILNVSQAEGYGRTYPEGDISIAVNDTLEIICTLDLTDAVTQGRNSSHLFFTYKNHHPIDKKYVHILNETSVLLRIENMQETEDRIICKSDKMGVSFNNIYVGSEPGDVHNFKCRSNNWQNMTCSFERPYNPVVPEYSLYFSFDKLTSSTQYPCQLTPDYNRSYICSLTFEARNRSAVYRQSYEYYYFRLVSMNRLGNHTQHFTINHYESVVPSAPVALTTTNITSRSAVLHWRLPLELETFPKNLTHLVNYTSEFLKGQWVQLNYISSKAAKVEVQLNNLPYAYDWYDVRVSTKVLGAPDLEEMWSNFSYHNFKTAARTPDDPPLTDIGGFSINDNDHVFIFWKELQPSKHNGENMRYNISLSDYPMIKPHKLTHTSAKYERLSHRFNSDLDFMIYSENSVGRSSYASHVRVPVKRLHPPIRIKKMIIGKNYSLSWSPSLHPSTESEIISYTVFWCVSKNELPNQCEGSLDFERVDSNVLNFTRFSNETLNFAVSANSRNSSSGMNWALCTALENNDIGKLTTIWIGKMQSTYIEFKWNLACVDRTILDGYILSYCPIKDPKTLECKESVKRINITSDAKGYNLTNLMPYTTYKTEIQMFSANRTGPASEPLVNTTLESAPSRPRNLKHSDITNTSVTLEWDVPEFLNGVLVRYKVFYNGQERVAEKRDGSHMQFVLDKLDSYTEYEILVLACTVACSEASNAINIKTLIGAPGDVQGFRMLSRESEIIVVWQPPLVQAGPIQYYEFKSQVKNGKNTKEYSVQINGTQCTIAFKLCPVSRDSYAFSVRAVNVVNSPHYHPIVETTAHPSSVHYRSASQSGHPTRDGAALKYIDLENSHESHDNTDSNLLKRHSNAEISNDSNNLNRNEKIKRRSDLAAVDIVNKHYAVEHIEFDASPAVLCREQDNIKLQRYLKADKFATHLHGEWTSPTAHTCVYPNEAGGFYFMLVFLIIFTMAIVYGSFFGMKKLKKMKDIGVELPAGLEDIKQESNPKNLDCGITTRSDVTRDINLVYSSEQEQSLLRMESGNSSSNSTENNSHCEYNEMVDDSECEHPNEDDSAQTLSENLEIEKMSPTPLLPVDKNSPLPIKKDTIVVTSEPSQPATMLRPNIPNLSSSNYVQMPPTRTNPHLTSNGYVKHDALVGKPVSSGYTPWSAIENKSQTDSPAQTPNTDEHKLKTPIVASTDIQGISGYVTHKQLSDFGQLMH